MPPAVARATRLCAQCGVSFIQMNLRALGKPPQKFCSRRCASRSKGGRLPLDKELVRLRLEANRLIDERGCWLWQLGHTGSGYGALSIDGRGYHVHRVALWVWKDIALTDLRFGLHSCDVRGCFNPDHVEMGDQAKNIRDAYIRNRAKPQRGEAHGSAKLTSGQVAEIRRLGLTDAGHLRIAERFGVSRSLISMILAGKRWA